MLFGGTYIIVFTTTASELHDQHKIRKDAIKKEINRERSESGTGCHIRVISKSSHGARSAYKTKVTTRHAREDTKNVNSLGFFGSNLKTPETYQKPTRSSSSALNLTFLKNHPVKP